MEAGDRGHPHRLFGEKPTKPEIHPERNEAQLRSSYAGVTTSGMSAGIVKRSPSRVAPPIHCSGGGQVAPRRQLLGRYMDRGPRNDEEVNENRQVERGRRLNCGTCRLFRLHPPEISSLGCGSITDSVSIQRLQSCPSPDSANPCFTRSRSGILARNQRSPSIEFRISTLSTSSSPRRRRNQTRSIFTVGRSTSPRSIFCKASSPSVSLSDPDLLRSELLGSNLRC